MFVITISEKIEKTTLKFSEEVQHYYKRWQSIKKRELSQQTHS